MSDLRCCKKIRNKSFYLEITDNGNSSVGFFSSVRTMNKGMWSEKYINIYLFFPIRILPNTFDMIQKLYVVSNPTVLRNVTVSCLFNKKDCFAFSELRSFLITNYKMVGTLQETLPSTTWTDRPVRSIKY